MDVLSSLLAAPRGESVFVLRSDLRPPWAITVHDRAPLTVLAVVQGRAVLDREDDDPAVELDPGDVALVRGPTGYTVGDATGTPAQAVIGPGQTCTRPDGSPLGEFRHLGVLAWTNVPAGLPPRTVLLTGTYDHVHQVSGRVLDQLPPVLVTRAGDADARTAAVLDLLAAETRTADAAQDAVLDRLVDLLLVSLLRRRLGDGPHRPPWYGAREHPVVDAALRRIHHEPHRRWTLHRLAADVGVSRATLARSFREVVGQPPMGYLTQWRLDLATDLLRTTDLTLESVAARVGYASAFSLSHAYARARGCPPSSVRSGRRR